MLSVANGFALLIDHCLSVRHQSVGLVFGMIPLVDDFRLGGERIARKYRDWIAKFVIPIRRQVRVPV